MGSISGNQSSVKGFDLHFLLEKLSSKLDNLHRDGRDLKSACPKCGGEDRFYSGPNARYQVFKCRQCAHVEFTDRMLGLDWKTDHSVIKPPKVVATSNVNVGDIRNLYASFALYAQAELGKHPHAIEYLRKRGVNPDEAKRLGLGFIDTRSYKYWYESIPSDRLRQAVSSAGLPRVYDSGRLSTSRLIGGRQGKIVFPYINQYGETVDLRTRSIGKEFDADGKPITYSSITGGQAERGADVPYGVDTIGEGAVIITEGEFKRLTPMALGASIPVVALRGTSDFTDGYIDLLRHNALVILAFDNDARKQGGVLTAGEMATIRIGRKLKSSGVPMMVLPPSKLGVHKGLDDWALATMPFGRGAFDALFATRNLVTLAEFEQSLTVAKIDLSKIPHPKGDIGTERRFVPTEAVDHRPHADVEFVSLDSARQTIAQEVADHLRNYKRGNDQLLITAPPGVGKTTEITLTMKATAAATNKTIAVVLPSHTTINEKIDEGMLAGFQHIYGHNKNNCEQSELYNALSTKGYPAGHMVCPSCPYLEQCKIDGYKSQFVGKANRAYVHAHLHSSLPDEDMVLIDEANHNTFKGEMAIDVGDLAKCAEQPHLGAPQRKLLQGLMMMYAEPAMSELEGREVYDVLVRYFGGLYDVTTWGSGDQLQDILVSAATTAIASREFAKLPMAFGDKLLAIMTGDVRRMIAGEQPTGCIRLTTKGYGKRVIELVYSKGGLPAWYSSRPVVLANATADAEVMQELMGPMKVVSPQVAIAEGNAVIQDITLNNAKSNYLGSSPEAKARRTAWIKRIRSHIDMHPGGEADTTIITVKDLVPHLTEAFPKAKIGYYLGLEGRNDLQSGLTILANSIPVNVDAIARVACALWPGTDVSMTRASVAFEQLAAGDEMLAVEQLDAVDKNMARLIWQARDATAVQAVHRSRIICQTGRTVVIMFSRPVPGIKPTTIITDREQRPKSGKVSAMDKLITIAMELVERDGGFSSRTLLDASGMARQTVYDNFDKVAEKLGLYLVDMPVFQVLAKGGKSARTMRVALPIGLVSAIPIHVVYHHYIDTNITTLDYMYCLKSITANGWEVDVDSLVKTLMNDEEVMALVDAKLAELSDSVPAIVPTIHEESHVVSVDSDWVNVFDLRGVET